MERGIPKAVIEDIRQRADIVEVIGSYLQLKRSGADFSTICPLHKEKTSSFHVNPARQSYHCFGCGAGGDIFKFLQEYEGVDFPTSVKMLAQKVGVDLSRFEPEEVGKLNPLYEALARASRHYQELLWTPEGREAREYIMQKRGIKKETIEKFGLGFAPEKWDFLINLLRKDFDVEVLEQAGLIARIDKSTGERYYDRFRNRLMFPILDNMGRVIAFSGRTMQKGQSYAKYVNSPETELYKKSRVLYALEKARRAIYDTDQAVIVEGNIDVIRCHQEGNENVIAPCGTAFTEEHADLLRKRFPGAEFVIAFDGDNPGREAAARVCSRLLGRGNFQVCSLPEGEDPASLFENGDSLKAYLSNKRPCSEYLIDFIVESRNLDIKTFEGSSSLLAALRKPYQDCPEQYKGLVLEFVSKKLNVGIQSLERWFSGDACLERESKFYRGDRSGLRSWANTFMKLLIADRKPRTIDYYAKRDVARLLPEPEQRALFEYLVREGHSTDLMLNQTGLFGTQTRGNIIDEVLETAQRKGVLLNKRYLAYLFYPTETKEKKERRLREAILTEHEKRKLEKQVRKQENPELKDLEKVFFMMRLTNAISLLRSQAAKGDIGSLEAIVEDLESKLEPRTEE